MISYSVRSAGKACDGWTDKRILCSIRWDRAFGLLRFMFTLFLSVISVFSAPKVKNRYRQTLIQLFTIEIGVIQRSRGSKQLFQSSCLVWAIPTFHPTAERNTVSEIFFFATPLCGQSSETDWS